MSVLLASLLRWHYLPTEHGVRLSSQIEVQRLDVSDLLDDSPSLRAEIDEAGSAEVIWSDALARAAIDIEPDSLPLECPWPSVNVLSEGWLPASTAELRRIDLGAYGLHIEATYIRVGGRGDRRIRYHRTNVGRRRTTLPKKVQTKIARMALVISVLSPDLVDTILSMPAAVLGRLVKREIRRARKQKYAHRLVKRRPVRSIFRLPVIAPRDKSAQVAGQRTQVFA